MERFSRLTAALFLLSVIVLLSGCKEFEAAKVELDALVICTPELSSIPDGIYHGSYAPARFLAADVDVAMASGRIESIAILRHKNGRGKKAEAITGRIVAAQSLEVESISGATYSSRVILKATERALAAAP